LKRAKQLAPVGTGRLRANIYSRLADWILTVGAKAPYARYHRIWNQDGLGRGIFLLGAIQENLAKIENIIR